MKAPPSKAPARSPVSLVGRSLTDLRAPAFDAINRVREPTLEALRSSATFRKTGRVAPGLPDPLGHVDGISVSVEGSGKNLRIFMPDGRHRLQVGRELGLKRLWGTVRRVGSGRVMFRGWIPIGGGPSCRTIDGVSYDLTPRPAPCRIGRPSKPPSSPSRSDESAPVNLRSGSPNRRLTRPVQQELGHFDPLFMARAQPAPRVSRETITRNKPEHPAASELGQRIERIGFELGGNQWQQRVRLSLLRAKLGDVPRATLDRTLLEMQRADRLVLYRLDNPREVNRADEAAALDIAGHPRHLAYFIAPA